MERGESFYNLITLMSNKNVYDSVLKHFVDERYARNCGLYWSNIVSRASDMDKCMIGKLYS